MSSPKALVCLDREKRGFDCGGKLKMDKHWLPERGMNPRLRQYHCISCEATIYIERGRKDKYRKEKGGADGSKG